MAVEPSTTYGVRIRITPNTGNSSKSFTQLYTSPTSAGTTKTLIAVRRGTTVWYFDDERPVSSGKLYYWTRTVQSGLTDSAYIGPVDAEPSDLETEV
jgi:hypothetical protein